MGCCGDWCKKKEEEVELNCEQQKQYINNLNLNSLHEKQKEQKDKFDVKFHCLNDTSLDNSTTQALFNKRKGCGCEDCDYCIVVKRNGIDESYIFIKGETAEEITKTYFWGGAMIGLFGFKIEEKTGAFLIREDEKKESNDNSYITSMMNDLLFYFKEQGVNKKEPKVKIQGLEFGRFKQMIEGIVEDYKKRQNKEFKGMNNQGIGPQNENEINI